MSSIIRRIGVDPIIQLNPCQMTRLKSRFEVITTWPNVPVEGLLVHSKVSETFLKEIHGLQWVAVRAKNTDYVPKTLGLRVFGTPSLGAGAVSEHVFALILGLYKQTIPSHQNVQTGLWRQTLAPNRELSGKTLGLVGYGTIGKQVGEIAKAFGMKLSIVTSSQGSLEELLKESDIVSLHVSQAAKQIISAKELALMKPTAILINTSRGYAVDQKALLAALEEGKIAGAGLDVYAEEPTQLMNPKILCTPHMGFNTEETLEKMNEALVNLVIKEIH